jgi:hypothetical protein
MAVSNDRHSIFLDLSFFDFNRILLNFCFEINLANTPSPTPNEQAKKSTKMKKSAKFDPHGDNKENVIKLPLNDTVEKEDPNSFSNKIKEAIARYDEEQQRHGLEQQQQQSAQQSQAGKQTSKTINNVSHVDDLRNEQPYNPSLPYSDDDSSRSNSPDEVQEANSKPNRVNSAPAFSFGANNSEQQKKPMEPFTFSQQPVTNKANNASDPSNSEQMLIEKDGVFTLMTKEEYTAMERKREEEERKNMSINKSNNNKQNNKPIIPHPPTRPKTSNDRNASLKNRFITAKMSSNDESSNNTSNPSQIKRVSRSADYNSRRERQKR